MALVERAELITTLEEAREYYRAKLVGEHVFTVRGEQVRVLFERKTTHLYSEEVEDVASITPRDKVVAYRKSGAEIRRFSLDRAHLLDEVLPALRGFTYSIAGTGFRGGDNRLVHGPRLRDGRYMRLALSRWQGERKYTCVSAYPVTEQVWLAGRRARAVRFP